MKQIALQRSCSFHNFILIHFENFIIKIKNLIVVIFGNHFRIDEVVTDFDDVVAVVNVAVHKCIQARFKSAY